MARPTSFLPARLRSAAFGAARRYVSSLVDNRLRALERRVRELEVALTGVSSSGDSPTGALHRVERRVEQLESALTQIYSFHEALEETIGGLERRVLPLDQSLRTAQAALASLEVVIEDLRDDFARVEEHQRGPAPATKP